MPFTRRRFLKGLAGAGLAAAGGLRGGHVLSSTKERKPNVLWIVNDASRAHNYSCYGHDRPTSPHIDELADRGVLFENAYSQYFWTAPSVSCFMSGQLFPERSTAFLSGTLLGEPVDEILAPKVFGDHGYRTLMITSNPGWVMPTSRLGEAFHEAHTTPISHYDRFKKNGDPITSRSLESMNEVLFPWLKKYREEPFFVYLHALETHTPYIVPPRAPFNEWIDEGYDGELLRDFNLGSGRYSPTPEDIAYLNGLYDGCIRYTDHHLERLLDYMDGLGVLDDTIVVYSSDHGEYLFDDGVVSGHTDGGADESHKIPLIVAGPGLPAGKRVSTPAQSIDILPTLLELCGIQAEGKMDGESLTAFLDGDRQRFAVTLQGTLKQGVYLFFLADTEVKYEFRPRGKKGAFWRLPDRRARREPLPSPDADTVARASQAMDGVVQQAHLAAENQVPKGFVLNLGEVGVADLKLAEGRVDRCRAGESIDALEAKWVADQRGEGLPNLAFRPGASEGDARITMGTRDAGLGGPYRYLLEVETAPRGGEEDEVSFLFIIHNRIFSKGVTKEFRVEAPPAEGGPEWRFLDIGSHDLGGKPMQVTLEALNGPFRVRRLLFFTDRPGVREKALEMLTELSQEDLEEQRRELEALGYL